MTKQSETTRRYARIMDFARRRGTITSAQAIEISGYEQGWYHLNALRRQGLLAHVGHNEWKPTYTQPKAPRKKIVGKNIMGEPWIKGQPWCPGCGRMEFPKNWTDCDCLIP